MRRSRPNYWSCSRLADWLRGKKKPRALGLDEWETWRNETKASSPVRYYLAENFLNRIQDFFFFPKDILDSFKNFWRNRFVTRTHCLKTGLQAGVYHELDERILHGLFNELKEFVEVELAWMHSYGNKKYKFKKGHCPEAGLDHLDWASGLKYDEFVDEDDPKYGKPTPQAESALVIKELYKWWTEIRPSRQEPADASGWSSHFENKSSDKDRMAAFKRLEKIEREYEKEDDKMLIKLIKIRRHLWT